MNAFLFEFLLRLPHTALRFKLSRRSTGFADVAQIPLVHLGIALAAAWVTVFTSQMFCQILVYSCHWLRKNSKISASLLLPLWSSDCFLHFLPRTVL